MSDAARVAADCSACDRWLNANAENYILASTPPIPRLKAPLLTVLEAKRSDIELGLGQCAAQMVAARMFNERASEIGRPLFGCITTGEDWHFPRLAGNELLLDRRRLYVDNVASILAVFQAIIHLGQSR